MDHGQQATINWSGMMGLAASPALAAWLCHVAWSSQQTGGTLIAGPWALILAPGSVALCILGLKKTPAWPAVVGLLIAIPCCVIVALFLWVLFMFPAPP